MRSICASVGGGVAAIVAGEFVSKAAHRPQFTRPMTQDGDVGVTGVLARASERRREGSPRADGEEQARGEADLTLLWDREGGVAGEEGGGGGGGEEGDGAVGGEVSLPVAPLRCGAGSPRLGPGTVGWSAGRRSGASGAGTGRDAAWTWTIDATRRDRLLPLAVFLSQSCRHQNLAHQAYYEGTFVTLNITFIYLRIVLISTSLPQAR